jgi:hypothetical protein
MYLFDREWLSEALQIVCTQSQSYSLSMILIQSHNAYITYTYLYVISITRHHCKYMIHTKRVSVCEHLTCYYYYRRITYYTVAQLILSQVF